MTSELESTPFLDKLSGPAWSRFATEYEAYVSRGGKRKVKQLIAANVLKLIGLNDKDLFDLDGQEFVNAVSLLFAPVSELGAFDRFRKLTRTAKFVSVDSCVFTRMGEGRASLCSNN